MNRLINVILIVGLFYSSANALELGQIKLDSYLNEPLRASFALKNIDADSLGDIILSVADQDTYKSMGLMRPYFLSKLTFKITAGPNAHHIVHISTRQRIKEPILDVLVKVNEKQSSLTRLYSILLDPREIDKKAANEASIVVNKPLLQEVSKAPQRQQDKLSPQKILVGDDSISIIAQNSPLHEKYSVYQIMRAFYLINTTDFLRGNINKLKSGSSLNVPDETMVAEVSRQKSINFVYAASKNDPFKNKAVVQQKHQDEIVSEPEVIAEQVIDKEIVSKSLNSINDEISQKNLIQQLGQSLLRDVKSWRTVSDEFKSLSSIVDSQNKALKVQSTVLQTINDQLEQKNQQIELLNLRLQALENIRLPGVSYEQGMLPENLAPLSSQNNKLLQQEVSINSINQSLSKREADINLIKIRVEELEKLERPITQDPLPTPVVMPELPVIKMEQNKAIISEQSTNSYLIWGGLLMALLLILIRERIWQGRFKSLNIQHIDVPVQSSKNEVTHDEKVVDNKKNDEVQQQEDSQLGSQKAPTVSNIKVADQKFKEAVIHAKEYKLDSTAIHSVGSVQEYNAETLYSEIDILIAYQLYEEAFKLVENARETLEGNSGLDIRELEILAYTKNVDIFFPKYELMKDSLAKEYPQAWGKIEDMHRQLKSEFQKYAIS